jgi:hypothetical protein
MAASLVARGSSFSDSAIGLDVGPVQDSEGDVRPLVVSWSLFFFGFPLRQATLYMQRRPLLTHRWHSGCCLGHATLDLAHESQANLIFCFAAGVWDCGLGDDMESGVVDIVAWGLSGLPAI